MWLLIFHSQLQNWAKALREAMQSVEFCSPTSEPTGPGSNVRAHQAPGSAFGLSTCEAGFSASLGSTRSFPQTLTQRPHSGLADS